MFNLGYPFVMLTGVDGNGNTEILAAIIVIEETEENYRWAFETFVSENAEACHNVRCIMTNKDGVCRTILSSLFSCPLYICIFHVAQIFNRTFTYNNYGIRKAVREKCLQYCSDMMWSPTDEIYNRHYNAFMNDNSVPQDIKQYFNNNWAGITEEWCVRFMVKGNFNNRTNNRIESLHQKLKAALGTKLTLMEFAVRFFDFLLVHQADRDH